MANSMTAALQRAGCKPSPTAQRAEKSSKGQQKSTQNGLQEQNDSYVGAPYNFVSQWDVVERSSDDCKGHNLLEDNLLSGEIQYRFTAETDIAVGEKDFYTDEYGRVAIPGSSVRGMIRSNAQVLSLSSIANDVDDYQLMFRAIGVAKSNPNKNLYEKILGVGQAAIGDKTISVLKNVKAGYLVNEGGKYVIYKTRVDQINPSLGEVNYYILSEREIQCDREAKNKYPFYWDNLNCLQHNLEIDFSKKTDKSGRVHYKGVENESYRPYAKKVSYRISGERKVDYVGDEDLVDEANSRGYALGTGIMNEKKCHYIIPEIDRTKESIELKEDDVRAYEIDYQHKYNQLKGMFGEKDAAFFDLPKDGECKPIFYINYGGRVYFGCTPRLRLFYKHSLKDGLKTSQRESQLDYAKTIFGFSDGDGSYKSRVSFSDALLISGETGERKDTILGQPSLSSYNDYLETDSNGNAKTYNHDDFQLRGVKQYWLHSKASAKSTEGEAKTSTSFVPLRSGAVFEGKVRFHNLTRAELGLVLWCIKLKPSSRQQIGKAKPYGYGRIRTEVLNLSVLDVAKAYTESQFTLKPFTVYSENEVETLIKEYKAEINGAIKMRGEKMIDELDAIKEFFAMKDSEHLPKPSAIRYMNLKEYQNRSPLPDVMETYGHK